MLNTSSQQKVLLFDMSSWKGHHEVYFKNILLTLLDNNCVVYAVCQDNPALSEWIAASDLPNCHLLNPDLSFVDKLGVKVLFTIDKILSSLSIKIIYSYSSIVPLLFIRNFLRQIGEDTHVFFAHADSAMPTVPAWFAKLFLPASWIALVIQPSYQAAVSLARYQSRKRFAAEKLFSLSSCKAVLVLHPVYQIFFEKRFHQEKIIVFPEIVDTQISHYSEVAEKIQYLASGRKIISIIGSFLPKRNLKLFLESAQKLSTDGYFILVIGCLLAGSYTAAERADIHALILTFGDNLYVNLEYYIPDEAEFNKLLDISDLIYLQYQDHPCSSNLLSKAIKLRKPVIINSGYLMEKVVRTYDWQAVSLEDSNEIAKEIVNLTHNFKINEEKYCQFLAEYNHQKNRLAICQALDFSRSK